MGTTAYIYRVVGVKLGFVGASYLSQGVARLGKGVAHINVSHCGLSSKGVNHIAGALCTNTTNINTLTYLNLSGNSLKDDITVRFLCL